MSEDWWRSELNPLGMSQGDFLAPILFSIAVAPVSRLAGATIKGRGQGWAPDTSKGESSEPANYLSRGAFSHAVVLSHSCDLDKERNTMRVLVAPAFPIARIREDERDDVLMQRKIHLMPLPEVPTLGTHYVDFRLTTVVDRKMVTDDLRIASMSESAISRLYAQILVFFTRLDMTGRP